jgi:hypothetical protein
MMTSTKKKKWAGPPRGLLPVRNGDKEAERTESVEGESGGDTRLDVSKVAASTLGCAEVAFSL